MSIKQCTSIVDKNIQKNSFFFICDFIGYQDTLFDVMGCSYYKDCYIEGELDFIFVNEQSFYETITHSLSHTHTYPLKEIVLNMI